MVSNQTATVLVSVFTSSVLVSMLYGIHTYIVPHLRRPKERPDITLPQTQRPSDPRLRDTLYSVPSPNFLDPRNSIAESDLRSSRWSTNLQDLSSPASPTPAYLPRSPVMRFKSPSRKDTIPRTYNRSCSDFSLRLDIPAELHKVAKSDQAPRRIRQTKSGSVDTSEERIWRKSAQSTRRRSKSDSQLVAQGSLLARSHASFCQQSYIYELQSPTSSNFSGATLYSTPHRTQLKEDLPRQMARPQQSTAKRDELLS